MATPFRATSLPLRRTQISNLLSLPPYLRSRAFHATSRRPFYNETIQFTHTILTSIHSISHTPWGLTIPLIALLVRGAFILPIALQTRRAVKKQIELLPLIQAWEPALIIEAKKKVGNQGQGEIQRYVAMGMLKKRYEIYKRFGVAPWKSFIGLTQIPIFLAVMETLRVMVGAREGFLGLIRSYWAGENVEEGVVATGDEIASVPAIPVEQDMATEGILWFPDLLIADPQLYLPFILSGTLLLNTFTSLRMLPTHGAAQGSKKISTRISGIIALAIGPLLLGYPSALVLYLVSSSFLNWLQTFLLAWWVPVPDPQQATKSKRPWRAGLGLKKKNEALLD